MKEKKTMEKIIFLKEITHNKKKRKKEKENVKEII